MTETLTHLGHGFATALEPTNLLWSMAGVLVGTLVGVLPGFGPALTIALLLPLTYQVDPAQAFMLFAGIYYGAMYGGSTTSILLNTPGETANIITAVEGHQMARQGRAGAALSTAAIGSFVAGTLGTMGLALLAEPVAKLALSFGPAEYFALMMLAFVTVGAVLTGSLLRGLTSLTLGVMFGLVGIDLQTGQPRFTFGITELLDGIDVIIVAVGLFAVGETLHRAASASRTTPIGHQGAPVSSASDSAAENAVHGSEPVDHEPADCPAPGDRTVAVTDSLWLRPGDWARSWKAWLRGAVIGFPLGAIPAGGAELPTFLSYWVERRLCQHPEEFGHGAIEGVAGPEAANNASTAGVLVPLLTLGLPTSATAAIMLSAFQSYGIQPGPTLLTAQPELVWGLIASLFIANGLLLLVNLPLVGIWVRILRIPEPMLAGGILVFATLGTWGISQSPVDLALLYGVGLLGFALRRLAFPLAPVIIGMILGPLAEQALRRALIISQGDLLIFIERPLAASLFVAAAAALVAPIIWRFRRAG